MRKDLKEIALDEDFDELPVKEFSYAKVAPNRKQLQKPKKRFKAKLIFLVILILLLAASSAYIYKKKHDTKIPVKVAPNSSVLSGFYQVQKYTTYTSSAFNLSLSLYDGWNVTQDSLNGLIVESPQVKLGDSNKNQQEYRVYLNILPTGVVPDELKNHNATAGIPSIKISYANPTASQLGQSYVSFITYYNENNPSTLNGIYLTGNHGYLKNDGILSTTLRSLNPTIFYSFGKCQDSNCTETDISSINLTNWNNKDFANKLTKIFESLSLS